MTSLTLTAFFSFITPACFVLSIWLVLVLLGQIPSFAPLSQSVIVQLKNILFILGSGRLWEGIVVMGGAGASVGILFETYALSTSKSNLAE